MKKTEFIEAVAKQANMTKTDAAQAVDAVINVIQTTLQQGEQVTLTGFGSFLVRERKARMGRNPITKEAIEIKASKVPAFRAGKGLKDALN